MALFERFIVPDSLPSEIILVENVSEERLMLGMTLSKRQDLGFQSLAGFFCNSEDEGYRSFGADMFKRNRQYVLNPKECRFFSSSQFVSRKFRDWIFKHSSMLDVQNCFYSLLSGYLQRHHLDADFPTILHYAEDRQSCWSALWSQLGKTRVVNEEFCIKTFFLSLLMGRSENSVRKDLELNFSDPFPSSLSGLMSEIRQVTEVLSDVLIPFVSENDRLETRGFKAMRRFLNCLESHHAIILIDTLKDIYPATLWIHDGLEIMGHHSGSETDNCELLMCIRHSLTSRGFFDQVKLAFKDKSSSVAYCERLLVEFGDKSVCLAQSVQTYAEISRSPSLLFGGIECCTEYAKIKEFMEKQLGLFRTMASNKVYWCFPGSSLVCQDYSDFCSAFAQLNCTEVIVKPPTKRYPEGEEVNKAFSFCKRWLTDPSACIFLDAGYYPDNKTPLMEKNLYKGVAISSVCLTESDKTNPFYSSAVDFFFDHIKFLCDEDEALYNWVLLYFAHMFQFPWEIPRVMLIFYSQKQGTGKSLLLVILIAIIGASHAILTGDLDSVLGKFNGVIEGKLLIGIDEGKIEKKEYLRTLKCLITGETLPVQNKNVNTKMVGSFCRVVSTTNEDVPVRLVEEEEDRRTLVIKCSGDKLASSYAERLSNIRHSQKVLRLIYDRFMSIPVSKNYDFSKNRPRSQFQEEMVFTSRSAEVEALIEYLNNQIIEHEHLGLADKQAMVCDTKCIYSFYDNYVKRYYSQLVPRMLGLKNYTIACKNWLGYTLNDSVPVHGMVAVRSNGCTLLKFKIPDFKPWFQTKSEFRL